MPYHKPTINFNNVVNNLNPSPCPKDFSRYACPDQYLAKIVKKNGKYVLKGSKILARERHKCSSRLNVDYSRIKRRNYVLIILESPHKDEFEKNTHLPIGPCCGNHHGSTGYNLNTYLNDVFERSPSFVSGLNKRKYKLVIMNAVQYQASEGYDLNSNKNKNIRDQNWLYFWNAGFNDCLVKRIKTFLDKSKECHVINLCTISNSNLHSLVSGRLTNGQIAFFNGYHPAINWDDPSKRIINP